MAAVLAGERKKPREAAFLHWKRQSEGIGCDCATARPDLGRNRYGTAQAADSKQPQFALAVSRPAFKKACKLRNGGEPMWPTRADVDPRARHA